MVDDSRIDNIDIICPICGIAVSKKGKTEMLACQWVMTTVMFMDFLQRNKHRGGLPGSYSQNKPKEFGV